MNSPRVTEQAPAKLNLYLHVLGRRPDGFHALDSLVAFADVGDRVTVMETPAPPRLRGMEHMPPVPRLSLSGPFGRVLMGEDPAANLVNRAAYALAAALERPPSVMLLLDKHLPVASGIGGGSADAAATLVALARLWGVEADSDLLYRLGVSLGADVPACIAGRPLFLGGLGEQLDPAPALPETHVVLVNPGVPVSTPAVFKARGGPFSPLARFGESPADARALAALLAERRNDLTGPALTIAPEIAGALAVLDATPGCLLSRLSGSGATCFGLYAEAEEARRAADAIQAARPSWWVRASRLLPAPERPRPLPIGLLTPTGDDPLAPRPPIPFPDTGGWGVG